MASDELYEACLDILRDAALDEDDKTDRVEELVKKESDLSGKALENTVLDILWRYRNVSSGASPVVRGAHVRRQSPAPWASSRSGTPAASSPRSSTASPAPLAPPGLAVRPAMFRVRSSQQASPFTSPRASPRLAVASTVPLVQRSPSLEPRHIPQGHKPSITDPYGENGSDGDDSSHASSIYYGSPADAGASAAWIQPQTTDMTPYDILRSIFRDQKSDDEIETILEANGYDLSAAIASLMGAGAAAADTSQLPQDRDKTFLVGKSMNASSRPTTPAGQAKSPVICRYWLSTGQCLRADCRFSHDLTSHVCKYWLAGNCLAGDSCIFSHDPSSLMSGVTLQDATGYGGLDVSGAAAAAGAAAAGGAGSDTSSSLQMQDYQAFPSLQATDSSLRPAAAGGPSSTFSSRPDLAPEFIPSSQRAPPSPGLVTEDGEAFPTLGSAALRGHKKHHGKRGHGHTGNRERDALQASSSSMADVVRRSPAPQDQASRSPRTPNPKSPRSRGANARDNSAAVNAIPAPEHIPWLETGAAANQAYLKARSEAIRHGGARNKFLQSAAQAWNRNDVRAAKALSLRGQSENDLMRDAHREAARHLYEERNKASGRAAEVFVDLHGLHPAEAISYLTTALNNQRTASSVHRAESASAYLYAIVGTGHHSKGGRDKVGKAVRGHLNDTGYAYKDFSVPGDRGGSGGILGIDVRTGGSSSTSARHDHDEDDGEEDESSAAAGRGSPGMQHGKIRILKADARRTAV